MTTTPCEDLLSLWLRVFPLNPATPYKSPAHSSTGTRSKAFPLPQLVRQRFHELFHSPLGVLFHLSLAVLFTIGHSGVFSLTRWSSLIHTGFHVPHATRDKKENKDADLLVTGLSPSMVQDSADSPRSDTITKRICDS